MEKYLVLESSDLKLSYFPDNTLYHFRVKLNRRLTFEGHWVVALAELNFGKIDTKNINDFHVDVACNLCDSSLVGESQIPLLRCVDLRQGPSYFFTRLFNIPIVLKETPNVEVYVKGTNGTPESFHKEEMHLKLLLCRYPFLD